MEMLSAFDMGTDEEPEEKIVPVPPELIEALDDLEVEGLS
jgi:hypothetical protein